MDTPMKQAEADRNKEQSKLKELLSPYSDNANQIQDALTALNEIRRDYQEEYGAPELLLPETRSAIAENLIYMGDQWGREGNDLMAVGLADIATSYL